MTERLRLTLLVLLLTVTRADYFHVIATLFTTRVAKTQTSINITPRRSFGLGMVNFFFFGLIAFVMLLLAEHAGSFV